MPAPGPARAAPTNRLLAALPAAEHRRLLPDLEPISLPRGHVLYQPDEPIRDVYFPHCGVISLMAPMEKGRSVEVGLIGREGMAGLPVFFGVEASPHRTVVQVAVEAGRMKAAVLRARLKKGGSLDGRLRRFANFFLTQIAQTAACNRLHQVGERCSRWLLMLHSQVMSDHFEFTQEFLAQMLGVRRASVSQVASALQRAGLIHCRYGRITILDRQGLESASCGCYRIVKAELDRLHA